MTSFVFTENLSFPNIQIDSAALGTAGQLFDNADVGKPVKLGTANNFVLCAAGNEIDGFINSVSAEKVNGGFSFGGVQRDRRIKAVVDATQAPAMAVGDLVVSGATSAVGTADAYPKVKTGTPALHKWRVISLSGAGAVGTNVLIEKL